MSFVFVLRFTCLNKQVLGSDALRHVESLRVPVCSKSYLKGEIFDDEFTVSFLSDQQALSHIETPIKSLMIIVLKFLDSTSIDSMAKRCDISGCFGSTIWCDSSFDCWNFGRGKHSQTKIWNSIVIYRGWAECEAFWSWRFVLCNLSEYRHWCWVFTGKVSFFYLNLNRAIGQSSCWFRLDLTYKADLQYRLSCLDGAEKPLPAYIPSESSIRYILAYCLDIRRTPGRVSFSFECLCDNIFNCLACNTSTCRALWEWRWTSTNAWVVQYWREQRIQSTCPGG